MRLTAPLAATASSEDETVALQVRGLSLGGGLCSTDRHLAPGTVVTLRLGSTLNPIRARAFMRDTRMQTAKFEFADMDLDERARLRHFLHENAGTAKIPAPSKAQPTGTES